MTDAHAFPSRNSHKAFLRHLLKERFLRLRTIPIRMPLGGRRAGFSPPSGRSLLFAFRVGTTLRGAIRSFVSETLQATSLQNPVTKPLDELCIGAAWRFYPPFRPSGTFPRKRGKEKVPAWRAQYLRRLAAFEIARQRYGRKKNVETLPATSQKQERQR